MQFSVVIAVRNERRYIEECLASIFSQRYQGAYEVLVIDGMSDDGTYELLDTLQKRYPFQLFRNPQLNAAAGRNIGIEHAGGNYIAFIDGDAYAQYDWLEQIEAVLESPIERERKIAGAGGPDLLPEESTEKARNIGQVMTSSLARGGRLNPSTQHTMMERERLVDHIPTCNLCLKRDVLDEVGIFDEAFVKGQDLELNYRIRRAGYKLLYSPKIAVVHHRKDHIRVFARQIYKWAKAKVAIIKKHGMRGLLSHIYLWPVYFLTAFVLSVLVFALFSQMVLFGMLFTLAVLLYLNMIVAEAGRLANEFRSYQLFFYATMLLPCVHFFYSYGVLVAVVKRDIW